MKFNKKIIKWFAIILALIIILAIIIKIAINNDFDRIIQKASKNLTEYSIIADYDEVNKSISASETISYLNVYHEELNVVSFHLYPVAFKEDVKTVPYTALTEARCFPNGKNYGDYKILGVNVDGQAVVPQYLGEDREILSVGLTNTLAENKRVMIKIDFLLTLPNCTHRLGWFNDNVNLGNWFPIACEYNGGGNWDITPYYATGDPFNSTIANFNVSFSAPLKYTIVGSGENISVVEDNDKKIAKFEGKAIRDFAVVLTADSDLYSDSLTNTRVNYFSNEDKDVAAKHLKLALEAIFKFNDWFGDYPYRTLNIVSTPFMQGGMEYPGLIYVSNLITNEDECQKVIVHEIAHQWWYGVVGNNQVVDAWFDEGLAEYSTFLFFDKLPHYGINLATQIEDALAGYNLYLEVFNTISISVNRKMNLPVNEYQSEYEYTYMVYVKGALMFNEVYQELGEKDFFKGIKKLYKTHKFSKVTKSEVVNAFGSKKDKVDQILTAYINGVSKIDV